MKQLVISFLALSVAWSAFAAPPVKGDAKKATTIVTQVCSACHGPDGNGISPPNPDYPKLAGKQPEYLLKQLKDFQAGKRKNDIMAGMVASLSPDDMANLALYFAAQKNKPNVVNNPELLEFGRKFYTDGNPDQGVPACAGCHLPGFLSPGPRCGFPGEIRLTAQEMVREGPQAEAAEDEGRNRRCKKTFQDVNRDPPFPQQRCADCQRKGAGHALGEAPWRRRGTKTDGAGPGTPSEVVEDIEGVRVRQQRAPPQDRGKTEKNSRGLKHHADEDNRPDHPRLKEQRLGTPVSVAIGILQALLENEIPLTLVHRLLLSETAGKDGLNRLPAVRTRDFPNPEPPRDRPWITYIMRHVWLSGNNGFRPSETLIRRQEGSYDSCSLPKDVLLKI